MGVAGFGGPPPRKFENCKLMCNRLRMLHIGRYAPGCYVACKLAPHIISHYTVTEM